MSVRASTHPTVCEFNKKTPRHRATRYFGCEPFTECSYNVDSAATDANEPNYIVLLVVLIKFIAQTDKFRVTDYTAFAQSCKCPHFHGVWHAQSAAMGVDGGFFAFL